MAFKRSNCNLLSTKPEWTEEDLELLKENLPPKEVQQKLRKHHSVIDIVKKRVEITNKKDSNANKVSKADDESCYSLRDIISKVLKYKEISARSKIYHKLENILRSKKVSTEINSVSKRPFNIYKLSSSDISSLKLEMSNYLEKHKEIPNPIKPIKPIKSKKDLYVLKKNEYTKRSLTDLVLGDKEVKGKLLTNLWTALDSKYVTGKKWVKASKSFAMSNIYTIPDEDLKHVLNKVENYYKKHGLVNDFHSNQKENTYTTYKPLKENEYTMITLIRDVLGEEYSGTGKIYMRATRVLKRMVEEGLAQKLRKKTDDLTKERLVFVIDSIQEFINRMQNIQSKESINDAKLGYFNWDSKDTGIPEKDIIKNNEIVEEPLSEIVEQEPIEPNIEVLESNNKQEELLTEDRNPTLIPLYLITFLLLCIFIKLCI